MELILNLFRERPLSLLNLEEGRHFVVGLGSLLGHYRVEWGPILLDCQLRLEFPLQWSELDQCGVRTCSFFVKNL
jgi:hypothetical protein